MPLPTVTLDAAVERAKAVFRTAFSGLPLGVTKFLGRMARSVGMLFWGLHGDLENLDRDIVPSPQSSNDALSDWAALIGLPDGAGSFGRRGPQAATGGQATLTGLLGTVYPDQLTATAEDGTTQILLSGTVIIPGSGSGSGSIAAKFVALTKGAVGNLPKGTICTWESAPTGADARFILTSTMSGGADSEDNPSLFARIVRRWQTPPRGGTAEDYRIWGEASGASHVFVYPRRAGTGTVDVVITVNGSGTGRKPSGAIQTAVQAFINGKRPAAVEHATVLLPNMPGANGHLIRVRVKPALSKYRFDWGVDVDWSAGAPASLAVDLYASGPPATIRLSGIAPQSLKDAIDAFNAGNLASAPRLQVASTGTAVNLPIKAIAWSDGGGKTTLTLEVLPEGWTSPAFGNTVFAGGPVVATIAAGELALVDSLGPSRVSGYGDPDAPWQDTLTVNQLVRVAEDAIDTDGTRLIETVLVGGATIDGVAADVEPADHTTDPPELLYAKSIAVTA